MFVPPLDKGFAGVWVDVVVYGEFVCDFGNDKVVVFFGGSRARRLFRYLGYSVRYVRSWRCVFDSWVLM